MAENYRYISFFFFFLKFITIFYSVDEFKKSLEFFQNKIIQAFSFCLHLFLLKNLTETYSTIV